MTCTSQPLPQQRAACEQPARAIRRRSMPASSNAVAPDFSVPYVIVAPRESGVQNTGDDAVALDSAFAGMTMEVQTKLP